MSIEPFTVPDRRAALRLFGAADRRAARRLFGVALCAALAAASSR